MKVVEKGFVLSRTSYSETSYVIKCFTKNYGIKSFLFQGAKKKYPFLIQAMSPIEFTFNLSQNDFLAKMYQVDFFYAPTNIPFNTIKTSIVFFQTEILKNILIEGQVEKQIFSFIEEEFVWLNENETLANYIIFWLFELITLIGFDPKETQENDFLYKGNLDLFERFKTFSKTEIILSELNKTSRKLLIEQILLYYKEKIPNFNTINSLKVFHEIWYE